MQFEEGLRDGPCAPQRQAGPADRGAAGLAAIIVSPIAWSIGSLYASHRAVLPQHPLMATGSQMVAGSAVLAVMSVVTGEPGRFDATAVSTESFAAFLYLTIVGSHCTGLDALVQEAHGHVDVVRIALQQHLRAHRRRVIGMMRRPGGREDAAERPAALDWTST